MKLDFEKMGLKPIIYPLGYGSTMCNKQYWFDHKFDEALYLDKAFVKRKLEVAKQAFEKVKDNSFEVTKSGKTLTTDVTLKFEKKNVDFLNSYR